MFLEIENLEHSYRQRKKHVVCALKNLNLEIKRSGLVGVLGPNGSGKSTLFKILSTQLEIQKGEIKFLSFDLSGNGADCRKQLGVTFQSPSLDPWLTVKENLEIQAAIYGIPNNEVNELINKALIQFELVEKADALIKELSGGLARRVELAKTLRHTKVMLLDEPTSGLDPQARRDFWKIILNEVKKR